MPKIGDTQIRQGANRNRKFVWATCEKCGTERWVRLDGESRFCVPCSRKVDHRQGFGNENSNWKESPTCKETGRYRARNILGRNGYCNVCGGKGEIHHIDGNTTHNNLGNLEWLCRKHHMEKDGRLDLLHKKAHPGYPDFDPKCRGFCFGCQEECPYECRTCGEFFTTKVWHCPKCNHHHGFDRTQCNNCYANRTEDLQQKSVEGWTQTRIAKVARVSHDTIAKVKVIEKKEKK